MAINLAYRYVTTGATYKLSADGSSTPAVLDSAVLDSVSCYDASGVGTGMISIGLYNASGASLGFTYGKVNEEKTFGNIISDGTMIEVGNTTGYALECSAVYHSTEDTYKEWKVERWQEMTLDSLMIVGILAMIVAYSFPYWLVIRIFKKSNLEKGEK